jgi:VWFA-related protein
MRASFGATFVGILFLGALGVGREQGAPQAATLVIDAPSEGGFLFGVTTLRAHVAPATIVARVVFLLDGKEVCASVTSFECTLDAGPRPKAHEIAVVVTLAGGARLRASVRTVELLTESVQVRRVTLAAVVTDPKGHAITGLTRDSFRVFEDDVEQGVDTALGESPNLHVSLALDVSASMAKSIASLKRAVVQIESRLKDTDKITLIAFNDRMRVLGQSTADHRALASQLDGISPTGGTALYDTLIKSVENVGPEIGVNRALVVFTDGVDTRSLASATDVRKRVGANEVTVYFVTSTPDHRSEEGEALMQDLVQETGGLRLHIDSVTELGVALTDILANLEHQYLISYEPPSPAGDGRFHRVTVQVVGHGKVTVRTRPGYTAIR